MKCARVEALLPLFVEGDLRAIRGRAVASHLRSCARCGEVADGYRASQRRLRLYGPSEVDDALLDAIRESVMKRLEREARRPGRARLTFDLLPARRLALAAVAVFIAAGAILALLGERGRDETAGEPVAARNSVGESAVTGPGPAEVAAPGVARVERPNPERPTRTAPRVSKPAPARSRGAGTRRARRSPADESDPVPPQRIELQTSDPLIRIIWFAPGKARDSGATTS
jgi:hypothetical protein